MYMRKKAAKKSAPLSEDVLHQMAKELNRLSSSICRDIKDKSILKALSNLTAIAPLRETLLSNLSNALFEPEKDEQQSDPEETPGYL